MSKSTKRHIRIFVSSPGDCAKERLVLDEVVKRVNQSDSDQSGIYLETFKWEANVVPRIGPPPQTVIDDQTPLCDIYLGIMSARFGGDDKRESGTEQEFRNALEQFKGTGRPWILFYFNEHFQQPRSAQDAKELARVFEFRTDLEKLGIVTPYLGARGDENGFFEKVELHLRELLKRPEIVAAKSSSSTEEGVDVGVRALRSSKPPIPLEYLTWLQSTKCASVELFGLEPKHGTAKLQTVYVPLTTTPSREDLSHGAKSTQKRKPWRVGIYGSTRPTLLLSRLEKESLYVTGGPGSGKSTFSRWVIWLACERHMPTAIAVDPPDGYSEVWPKTFANRLPIFVRLSEFFPSLPRSRGRELSRSDLESALVKWVESSSESLTEQVVHRHLANGSTLLILDGLDEVPKVADEDTTRWSPRALLLSGLANSCAVWGKAGNRILITSRPYGLASSDLAAIGLAHAPILDLDFPLKKLLIQRWFDQLRGSEEGENFSSGLLAHFNQNKWLEPLSVNPLLLTGMCIVYDEGGKLPQDPHDLYSRVVNSVLHSRYRDDVVELETARRRLQAIAYGMHTGPALEPRQAPTAEASLNEIDSILSDYLKKSRSNENDTVTVVTARDELLLRSGLFQARGDNKAGFYHLSFQEFLAGQRIADLEDDVFPLFVARAESADWRNTLLLLFAGLTPERAVRLVDRLASGFALDQSHRQAGLQTLVAECFEILHGRGLRLPEVAEDRCRTAFQATMVSSLPADVRCRAGSALGLLGDPRFHDADSWCLPREPALGFIEIPPGPFTMGTDRRHDRDAFDEEMPRHRVMLPRYYIARWPVTVAQFRAFAAHRDNRGFVPRDPDCLKGVANHPVSNVSRQEAFLYCEWLTAQLQSSARWPRELTTHSRGGGNRRLIVTLPSEAEWEKAARMSQGGTFPWGDDPDPNRANYVDSGIGGTSAVGCFPLGANPLSRVEDMSGNVWEWTRSIWKPDYPYKPGPTRETLMPTHGLVQTVRGGAFDLASKFVRATYRNPHLPEFRPKVIGFRIAVSTLAPRG